MRFGRSAAIVAGAVVTVVASAGPVLAAGGHLALARGAVRAQPTTWSIVHSPSRGKDYLYGVSCPSTTYCVTVGYSENSALKTLIESWDGTAWSIVASPNGFRDSTLYSVSCASDTACTAVGEQVSPGKTSPKTLIESWDGTAWSIVPSPSPGIVDVLYGVSCVSATACTAVGWWDESDGGTGTLIETWDGATWSVAPSENANYNNELVGVSCVSASACTAVGSSSAEHGRDRPLIESWNGTAWSIQPNPVKKKTRTTLSGVSCTAADACMAVGDAGEEHTALAESWNGTAWSVVHTPARAGGKTILNGVSCTAADSCTAAGKSYGPDDTVKTLIESWDGTAWTITPSPSPGGKGSAFVLDDVSCPAATTCMATGFLDRTVLRTLTELGT
jgi:hypothetical protein